MMPTAASQHLELMPTQTAAVPSELPAQADACSLLLLNCRLPAGICFEGFCACLKSWLLVLTGTANGQALAPIHTRAESLEERDSAAGEQSPPCQAPHPASYMQIMDMLEKVGFGEACCC